MRVKIMSMQRVENLGSFLQAYSMKRVLEGFGHQVSFCDFRPGTSRHRGQKVKKVTWLDRLLRLPRRLLSPRQTAARRQFHRKRTESFQYSIWPLLGMSVERNYDSSCDLMVIGSDEVFNYTNHVFGYVPELFGHNLQAQSIISYAASAGYTSMKDVDADGMAEVLASGFKNFHALGVRDQNMYEIVQGCSQRAPTLVVDPTLSYDFLDEVPPSTRPPGYLLVYAYRERLDAPSRRVCDR